MLIKVCGMRVPQNILAVDALQVDMIGFIFYDKSPRLVTDNIPHTKADRVGVFVNQTCNKILSTAQKYHLTHIQLHGHEDTTCCKELQEKEYKVIKAISIKDSTDIQKATIYEPYVDLLLFDTKCTTHGGSGIPFDWTIIKDYQGKTPFILSGGINPQSAKELSTIQHQCFVGIDINSGFEEAPAIKNIEKIKHFITLLQ